MDWVGYTRPAETYLRLYQLNLPTPDDVISSSIGRLDSFKEMLRQSANQYAPQELCQDPSAELYPGSGADQCEIARADTVLVLDSSMQANQPFMAKVASKLAQRLGLSSHGNSLSLLTNQQDTSGYAGAYSFNAILRNSTNSAEVGCALVYDQSRSYQGGQITEPTRLVEMFERALVNLDSEYLVRQSSIYSSSNPSSSSSSSSSSTYNQGRFVSSLFGQTDSMYSSAGFGPKTTGGAKTIVWFNYGPLARPGSLSAGPTSWSSGGQSSNEQNQYKFMEAKKYLRENFRGASILAVASLREDVKPFVYDEQRDIFTDIPMADSGYSSSASDASALGSTEQLAQSQSLEAPAEQLTSKLLQRMCDVPALFQYPLCFRNPSDGIISTGFISPGRKQYWMMAPKTFFASRQVRLAFRVEGGRIRVCFGRMSKPDETALKNPNGPQQSYAGSIAFGSQQAQMSSQQVQAASSADYYTGLDYGICKDVAPGQEIDFLVGEPCYKKSIAECEPFYFVITEISNPGEGDPNYMCKDEGCRRFDQVKFTLSHTGVLCSAAPARLNGSGWLLLVSIAISTFVGLSSNKPNDTPRSGKFVRLLNKFYIPSALLVSSSYYLIVQQVHAQQANPQDFGQNRYGEKRGNLTPSEVVAIILLVMTIVAGLALTIGLCYYVTKQNNKGAKRVPTEAY